MKIEEKIRAGILGIVGNILLFLLKIVLYIFSGSIAILTDAFHTLSDCISSGVMIVGIVKSKSPPDREHPYGHGRTEYFFMVFMAIILLYAGFVFAKDSLLRIIHPPELRLDVWILSGLFLTIIIKEVMAKYAFRVSKSTGSRIVQVDAWHHRFDTITSVFVLVSLIMQKSGIPYMDSIAGFVVGLVIVFLGFKFLKDAYDRIMGLPPSIEMVSRIREIAMSVTGVEDVHDFIISNLESFPIITFHIEARKDLKLEDAHRIADAVEKKVQGEFGGVVVVHVDPACMDEKVKMVNEYLKDVVKEVHEVQEILTVTRQGGNVVIEIVFSRNTNQKKKEEIMKRISDMIREKCRVENIEFVEKKGFLPEK